MPPGYGGWVTMRLKRQMGGILSPHSVPLGIWWEVKWFPWGSFHHPVPMGLPLHGGDVTVYVKDINQLNLPTPFSFCSCVYFCLHGPFNRNSFHKFSWQLSVFSLCSSSLISALLVLSIIYLFIKVSFSPDIISSGWQGSKHQLTNFHCPEHPLRDTSRWGMIWDTTPAQKMYRHRVSIPVLYVCFHLLPTGDPSNNKGWWHFMSWHVWGTFCKFDNGIALIQQNQHQFNHLSFAL